MENAHLAARLSLLRADHFLVLVLCAALLLAHFEHVSWARFAVAFVAIDLIGFLPGALRRAVRPGEPIAPIYYALYNAMHSMTMGAVCLLVWASALGGPEWAMLAIPLHLCGDRGLLGNWLKPRSEPFLPGAHPA